MVAAKPCSLGPLNGPSGRTFVLNDWVRSSFDAAGKFLNEADVLRLLLVGDLAVMFDELSDDGRSAACGAFKFMTRCNKCFFF